MNREELRDLIRSNLTRAGLANADLRVQPDPFGGFRVVIISDGFLGKSLIERRALALEGIPEEQLEFLELLTKSEAEWEGSLISDTDFSQLPLWADAMARSRRGSEYPRNLLLPSELDTDLTKPFRVTFYSMRGGVGRSTALGYVARILASKGHRIVCVDLDLEAPGLGALFGIEPQVRQQQGVLHLLHEFDRGGIPDITKHLIRVSEKDELYCIPAGHPNAEYARLLRYVNPSAWYTEDRNPLRCLVDAMGKNLPFTPDVILFDSRTGISEISGPLLFDLPDMAVVVFFPHPQAQDATGEVVRALLSSRTQRTSNGQPLTPEPRFLVSPVPSSRIPEVVNRYRNRAAEWISTWLEQILPGSPQVVESLADAVHFIPYREEIATSDIVSINSEVWRDYEPVADWVERFLPASSDRQRPIVAQDKGLVLEQLNFSAGTAEHQNDFLSTFVEVGSTRKALDPDIPLVLGRKGVGKTAVFRRLLEKQDIGAIALTSPAPLRGQRPWILSADGFAQVDALLQNSGHEWRHFWQCLVLIACRYSLGMPVEVPAFQSAFPSTITSTLEFFQLLEYLLKQEKASLIALDILRQFDQTATSPVMLLFDGLDTGFGNGARERFRRRTALEGLFEFIVDWGASKQLLFKVMLREDIWKVLRFENKSHLFGRYVTLDWRDQSTYYKVVLKQALKSDAFRGFVTQVNVNLAPDQMADWDDREVSAVWNLLVGERMKGEKTAFTRNWVWNRLADANGDHSPRYLLQLFKEVTTWENNEQRRTPYDRSVIRPRALSASLPVVSRQALDALKEEYPELDNLLSKLTAIGRTPVASEELADSTDQLSLAREVGLLGIYEGTEDQIERYRVPEIYRYALEMTRKGQA